MTIWESIPQDIFGIMYLCLKINVLLWHCSFLSCQSITILKWNMRAKRSGSRVLGCIIYVHTSQLDFKCEPCLWLAWMLTTYSLSLFIISELFLNFLLCSPSLLLCSLPQNLDFETKSSYTLKIEASNRNIDPRFLSQGPFSDTAMVRLTVENVDEPPIFSSPLSKMVVSEAAKVGTNIGTVSALDPDSTNSPIR